LREHFLPPLLAACFQQLDTKIKTEWDALDQRQDVQAAGEELTEEMKAESILRQLSYTAVVMMADFLDPARASKYPSHQAASHPPCFLEGCCNPEVQQHTNPCLAAIDPVPLAIPGTQTNGSEAMLNRAYPTLRKFCLMQTAIAEPMLLFGAHAIRFRDSRCCGVVLRVFRSIVPDFHSAEAASRQAADNEQHTSPAKQADSFPISPATARAARDFISSDVLKACITSLHEPYFVDVQKDIGSLIAYILVYFGPLTPVPREVLLSLPSVKPNDVDQAIEHLMRPGLSSRQQRAIVLDLLKDVKGVSISEMGKVVKSSGITVTRADGSRSGKPKSGRSRMAQEFMTAPDAPGSGLQPMVDEASVPRKADELEGLEGIAGLFGQ
jgi:exportin-5